LLEHREQVVGGVAAGARVAQAVGELLPRLGAR